MNWNRSQPQRYIHGDEQQVIRTMQKMSGWKLLAESISSLYQQFLTKMAEFPLPVSEQTKVKAAVEAATAALANIVTGAEEEDEIRQLYFIDTSNRGKQVKWSVFSGEVGENFF